MSVTNFLGFAIIAAALTGCFGQHGSPPPNFSPNGEPLPPPQWPIDCDDALGLWFDHLDMAHTGRIPRAIFEADAQTQFNQMDLRHDGKVTAEELSKYRLSRMGGHFLSVSTPDQRNAVAKRDTDQDAEVSDLDRAFGDPDRARKDRDHHPVDAFAALVTDQPDPVMSADTDLDGSVTWDEFQALVFQNIAELDPDHTGFITKSAVEDSCSRKR